MADEWNSDMINHEYLHAAVSSLLIARRNVTFASIVEDQELLNPIIDRLCRSQWPRGLRRRSAAARLLRMWFRIPPGGMDVCLL